MVMTSRTLTSFSLIVYRALAVGTLELEGLADPERLPVDLEQALSGAVLDPEVVPDRMGRDAGQRVGRWEALRSPIVMTPRTWAASLLRLRNRAACERLREPVRVGWRPPRRTPVLSSRGDRAGRGTVRAAI